MIISLAGLEQFPHRHQQTMPPQSAFEFEHSRSNDLCEQVKISHSPL